ncbi:MAG3720 family protein [Mycoplasma nasistruthionis]|uniref:Uncharacterized protein n=1 Tax=Mycoplasma nasistruthionis TaxID=353852 RepID=A0A5B7XVN7_9MOLU|nr:hypothetical protein [Mycoplasma nasistruthionis]QCZ36544.1 hypothetical protein FG904_00735 [Mycoplasma nasistruthionis]
MNKHIAVFHLQKQSCNFELVNFNNSSYFYVPLNNDVLLNKITFYSWKEWYQWYKAIVFQIKQLSNLQVAIVVDDDLFKSISCEVKINNFTKNPRYNYVNGFFEVDKQFQTQKQELNTLFNISTLKYSTLLNGIEKDYLHFPHDREFTSLKEYHSLLSAKNSQDWSVIKQLLQLNLKENQVKIYLKSQVNASHYPDLAKQAVVVDLNDNYLGIYACYNKSIIYYDKIDFDFDNILTKMANTNHISIKLLKDFLRNLQLQDFSEFDLNTYSFGLYNPNYLDESYEVDLQNQLIEDYKKFIDGILNFIYKNVKKIQAIQLINNLQFISFTGNALFTNLVKQLFLKNHQSDLEIELSVIDLNKNSGNMLFELEDSIIQQTILMSNNMEVESNQNNTVASRIVFALPKEPWFVVKKWFKSRLLHK